MPHIVKSANINPTSGKRFRRTPEASRQVALDAAQMLLLSGGPPTITLKAVAQATGMTHGNITHHFGTSSALHTALIVRMAGDLCRHANDAVLRLRQNEIGAEDVVDLVFSALLDTGCGRLIGWLSATGDHRALDPVFEAMRTSIRAYRAGEPDRTRREAVGAGPIALSLLSHALTACLIGEGLEAAAEMPSGSIRKLAVEQLKSLRATSSK